MLVDQQGFEERLDLLLQVVHPAVVARLADHAVKGHHQVLHPRGHIAWLSPDGDAGNFLMATDMRRALPHS